MLEDSGTTSLGLGGIAYGKGAGTTEDALQTLTYIVTAVPSSLGQIVLADGTTVVTASTNYTLAQIKGMQFKATLNANGIGNFTFTVNDDGTTKGVADPLSLTQTLAITVTAVNDPASIGGTATGAVVVSTCVIRLGVSGSQVSVRWTL